MRRQMSSEPLALDRPADEVADHDQHERQQERDTPTPLRERLGADDRGDGPHDEGREDHAERHADLRVRAEEAALVLGRVLDRHEGGPAPLAAGREALYDAQEDQQARGGHPDLRIRGQQTDEEGRHTHHDQGNDEDPLAPEPVAEVPGDDGAEGAEQEGDPDRGEGQDLRHGGVGLRQGSQEERGEDQARGLRVDEEVVPLDGGADDGACEHLAPFLGIELPGRLGGGWVGSCHGRSVGSRADLGGPDRTAEQDNSAHSPMSHRTPCHVTQCTFRPGVEFSLFATPGMTERSVDIWWSESVSILGDRAPDGVHVPDGGPCVLRVRVSTAAVHGAAEAVDAGARGRVRTCGNRSPCRRVDPSMGRWVVLSTWRYGGTAVCHRDGTATCGQGSHGRRAAAVGNLRRNTPHREGPRRAPETAGIHLPPLHTGP